MSKYINDLKEVMVKIKSAGWHNATRTGNTGIGKTFEDLLDKEEDNLDSPDFFDIEIKTHESISDSMITLFTKSPTYPRSANTYLRNNYGKLDKYGNKILHTTVSATQITNSYEYSFDFKIGIDYNEEIIRLEVYNKDKVLIDNSVFWSFVNLENQIKKKLSTIAIVSAESRILNGKKQYRYNEIDIVTELTILNLINAIENGDLKIDIRIGAYHMGPKKGKTHDHGTGFRILFNNLLRYASVEKLK